MSSGADRKSDVDRGIAEFFQDTVASLEDVIDTRWRRLKHRIGWDGMPRIVPYIGYANCDFGWVSGRVLTNPPRPLPKEDASWWDNLVDTYTRFESDEVADIDVEIYYAGVTKTVRTNDEGYFNATLERKVKCDGSGWHHAMLSLPNLSSIAQDASLVRSSVMVASNEADFGVISDIDDTVLQSDVSDILKMARLTFFGNARTRLPLPNVASLYHALQAGPSHGGNHQNPFFYVSSSPRNLHDLLQDFFELNDLPRGPLLLRDLGLNHSKESEFGHEHKLEKALRIMERYPNLSFVLMGDSAQQEAVLYGRAIGERPSQVAAVFIRDADPDERSRHDERTEAAIRQAQRHDVPMVFARTSREMAVHASALGLIDVSYLSEMKSFPPGG